MITAINPGGCAPPVQVPDIADKIAEYLRGDADYDPRQLLREAREEIQQLECAARLALSAADHARARQAPTAAPAVLIDLDVPAPVLLATDTVEQHFKRAGINRWQLGGIESRGYGAATG